MARPKKPAEVRKAATITFRVDAATIEALQTVGEQKQREKANDPFYRGTTIHTLSVNETARGLMFEALAARGLSHDPHVLPKGHKVKFKPG